MRWLSLSPVVVAAVPVVIAWLRGRWWVALVPYAVFVWAFATVVLTGLDESSGHPLQVVWLWSLVLLEFSVVPRPRPDSWWALRYRSRRMSRLTPGLLMGLAASLWLVLSPIAMLSIVVTFLLVAAVGLFAILAVVSTAGLLLGDRQWERTAFMAWGAVLPMAAVVAAFLGDYLVLGR